MRSLLVAVLALATISTSVLAQAPDSLSFQGLLTDSLGNPIDSTGVSMTFKLYKNNVAVWTEMQTVEVNNGVFNVLLGKVTDLSTLPFDQPMDLGIKLDGEAPEMSPRTPLAAAAYAKALPGLYTFYRDNGGDDKGYNVVGGAAHNVVGAEVVGATIGGGGGFEEGTPLPNSVLGDFATVGGGMGNAANRLATVGGGSGNMASGEVATVGGGFENTASGIAAVVPGGVTNQATGSASFAAGVTAQALHPGSFVWQDSTGFPVIALSTTAPNQFFARASGGFKFFTSAAPDTMVRAELAPGSGTWANTSSKASKTAFHGVDTRDYLDRVASLELNEWSYKTEGDVTHVGPMAEDFYSAFGHGPNDHSITTVDADGVALAAIQGLYELVKELQAENEQMRAVMERAGLE